MGYLKRRSKPAAAARPKPDGRCKKHPKHKQSPGVCSICLSEKLSQISGASSSRSSSSFLTLDSNSSSVSTCSLSSSSSTSCAYSPVHRFRYSGKSGAGGLSSLFGGRNVLTKSRSLVLVSRKGGDMMSGDKKKNDRSFLSKLLLGSRKKKMVEEGLVHSRTMREFRVHY